MSQQQFTRDQLYELVWSEPMTAVAKKYNISADALRKICEDKNIPTPKAGHWMKLQFGKTVDREPLPVLEEEMPEFSLHPKRGFGEGNIISVSAVRQLQQKIESELGSLLQVPDRLTKPDPLILRSKEIFDNLESYPGRYSGMVTCSWRGMVDITASPKLVPRALRFMDTLIKVLRSRGHNVKIDNGNTIVTMYDEKVEICILEKQKRELKKDNYSWQTATYHLTGLLAFKIRIFYTDTEWKDDKVTIEQLLSKIVAVMEIKAQAEHERTLERERGWQLRKEEERREKEREKLREKELSDFKNLLKEANRWREAQMLRDYINFVQKEGGVTGKDQGRKDWIQWASKKADWYDPQKNGPDKWLERVEKNNLVFLEEEEEELPDIDL